jgi:single-strand selective monofunctional uracil DNA glycosylase
MASSVLDAAQKLKTAVSGLTFADPVAYIYNPLDYAWNGYEAYVQAYGQGTKRIVFMGMNPGPFGMAQNGIPFGEIDLCRNWMNLFALISKPKHEHPKRPVDGFDCPRSEVSGRRLWGLFKERFGAPENFFADHFVINYCPLVFMSDTGRNITPDKLPAAEFEALEKACDQHVRDVVDILQPEWVIGVGVFAEKRLAAALEGREINIGRILHPSPASPAANRGWAPQATKQMEELGLW